MTAPSKYATAIKRLETVEARVTPSQVVFVTEDRERGPVAQSAAISEDPNAQAVNAQVLVFKTAYQTKSEFEAEQRQQPERWRRPEHR
jgi:hypothetical protein